MQLSSLGLPSTSFDIPASSNPSSKFRAQVPAISCFTGDRDYIAISGFPIWFGVILKIKKKHYPHTPSFKSEMRFLPTCVGKVKGPFSTSITIGSQFSLALFTIYMAPCVVLYHLHSQEIWGASFASNQRTIWALLWLLERILSIKQGFPTPELKDTHFSETSTSAGSLRGGGQPSTPSKEEFTCWRSETQMLFFPFPCIFVLKSTVRNLLFYILFNLYKSDIPTEHDKISYQEA